MTSGLACPCWPASQSSRATIRCPHPDDMIKAVCYLHRIVLVGASSTEQSGDLQVPGSRRHGQGCVIIALPCLCRRQLQRAVGPSPGARIDDMTKLHDQGCVPFALSCPYRRQLHRCPDRDDMVKAVTLLHCLVFVGASSTEQSGHHQVPGSRRHDQGCVMPLHCHVSVGASSAEQLGHIQVPASRRHDQGCVIIALPCLCRRQLQRAAGSPSGACIETT